VECDAGIEGHTLLKSVEIWCVTCEIEIMIMDCDLIYLGDVDIIKYRLVPCIRSHTFRYITP
jgi:hypothetical protein